MAVRREGQRQKERRTRGDGHHRPFLPIWSQKRHSPPRPQTRSQAYSLLPTWPEARAGATPRTSLWSEEESSTFQMRLLSLLVHHPGVPRSTQVCPTETRPRHGPGIRGKACTTQPAPAFPLWGPKARVSCASLEERSASPATSQGGRVYSLWEEGVNQDHLCYPRKPPGVLTREKGSPGPSEVFRK